jgi:hypothetical protein
MAILVTHSATIATAQTTAADTNILDRGSQHWNEPALMTIVTTIGATPTATYAILGSVDNVNYYPLPYADSLTPSTVSTGTFTITTAVTKELLLQIAPWRYIKVTISAVTNVTSTVSVASGE